MTQQTEPKIKATTKRITKILILSVLVFVLLSVYTAFAMEFRYFPEFSIFMLLLMIALQNKKVIEEQEAEE